MRRYLKLVILVAFIGVSVGAKSAGSAAAAFEPPPNNWQAFQFLIGSWSGKGIGTAGEGIGNMTVETDLDGAILKVTNTQDFAAKGNRAAFTYRGVMVVSPSRKALFVDNEGHALHYTVTVAPRKIIFLSDPEQYSPRFRFTYTDMGGGRVNCAFDVAPLETPNKFSIHISGVATKKR